MKDYSNFVNAAYLITFATIIIFGIVTIWQFRKSANKLNRLSKNNETKN